MSRTSLIIDCDPGVDDGVALLLAFAAPDALDLIAVTTVAGNVDAELTARNARIIRQIAGRQDTPVFKGAALPLFRAPVVADQFHGESGLGFLEVFEPDAPLASGPAANAIVEAVMTRAPGEVTLAVTGPMTNVALAMRLEPAITRRLGPVVVMGGARREGGNVTASAEYNIFADPHAAQVVFGSGCEVITFGLDATYQVRITPERLAAFEAIKTPVGQAVHSLLAFTCHAEAANGVGRESPLHDPCTIAFILKPELFISLPAQIRVETTSPLTLGHTAVEFRLPDPHAVRTRWVTEADADGVFGLLLERLGG